MDDLLKHHIQETKERFNELRLEVKELNKKLDDLTTFKTDLLGNAKMLSFLWSVLWGGILLVVTIFFKK